jgi:hypothetical protein|tara:strand:- start:3812 stop:3982 length:171 start_codon:yes stop_codon:yes gene_type:complete
MAFLVSFAELPGDAGNLLLAISTRFGAGQRVVVWVPFEVEFAACMIRRIFSTMKGV